MSGKLVVRSDVSSITMCMEAPVVSSGSILDSPTYLLRKEGEERERERKYLQVRTKKRMHH